jgi:hypothetical protein
MLRVAFVTALTLTLTGGMVACSDDDGGGNVCGQAWQKTASCVEGLNCDDLSGAEQMTCQSLKSIYEIDYDTFVTACEQDPNQTQCACEGANKEQAERTLECEFDELCQCGETPTDASTGGETAPPADSGADDAGTSTGG